MAEVFEAHAHGEAGFRRKVALKRILAAHRSDEAFVRMFLDEARLLGRLHHANVVSIFDFGLVDGHPFQVLEYVDGIDAYRLHRDAPGGSLPPAIALAITLGVAHGLAHAHGAKDDDDAPLGVVHRDVTPSNVLCSWDGDVKLSDFGIAFARDRRERTSTGVIKGKAAYMAPEQLFGGKVDARTDVFALGCVLHALVAGQSPLARDGNVERLLKDGSMPLDEGVEEDIAAIITKATQRDRDQRYATATELGDDVSRALARRQAVDSRTALRTYLAEHRAAHERAERGKLDSLLQVELVLGERSGALRSFTTKQVGLGDAPTQPAPSNMPPPKTRAGAIEPTRAGSYDEERSAGEPTRRSSRWPLGALAAVVAIVMGIGVYTMREGPANATPPLAPIEPSRVAPSRVERVVEAPPAEIVPAERAPVAPTATPPSEPTTEPAIEPMIGPAIEPPRPRVRPDRLDPRPIVTAPPEEPVVSPTETGDVALGALAIGGEGARRAEIFIGGRSYGFAPRRIELPFGEHEIVLRRDDQVIATRSVRIDASHTRSAPARVIVEP